jgi:histidinol-phosphate aminotransferase/imidazoleglycerol-phosphate dehydratase/histidinol-phosphatase
MNNWLQQITRPEIWAMKGYSSARSEMSDYAGMIQLDANENPFLPYPMSQEVSLLNRYPEPQPASVVSRLASIYGVNKDQVLVGRGMDEIMDLLVRVFCIPYQDKILYTPPTYGYYQVAADISGVGVVKVNLENDFSLDADKLIDAGRDKVKIVFICTPNNPTGNIIDLSVIEKITQNMPNSIIAIDEAYLEFADSPSAVTLLPKYQNLVVMKTLSKAYAFAGVRVGALLASPEIIQLISKVIAPYPIPVPSVKLIIQALSPFGLQVAQNNIQVIKQERERMYQELSHLPDIHVYKSSANYLLLKVDDASKIYQYFLARGIIIRNRSKDIPNTIRISIGNPSENYLVLSAFGIGDNLPPTNERTAVIARKTNETEVMVRVNLDKTQPIKIATGIGFFDHMLEQLAKHGGFSLQISANGDTHIDFHHTVEDVAITLGQALKKSLGDKRGINRYGFVLPMDEANASASIDLSGRGVLVFRANFPTPLIGNFPVELVEHFFLSLSANLEAAIHLSAMGDNSHHMAEGVFKACAKALGQAIKETSDDIPSTKGML